MTKTKVPRVTPRDGQDQPSDEEKVDERVRRSREVVLNAVSDILCEQGVSGLSVDEVARRSGVAKTTIYRHWQTRNDLVIEGCVRLSTPQTTPDTGAFGGDALALLNDLAHLLATAKWAPVLPSIIDAAERDADLATVHAKLQAGHTGPYIEIIERAKRKGELHQGSDTMSIVAELVGPLFYRRWFSRERLDARFVEDVVKGVVQAHTKKVGKRAL